MRIRWRGFELPTRLTKDEAVSTQTYGKFLIEPFERGFGTTIGNSIRRVLLSSLEGAAVRSVRIEGASHEFTSLEGVLEDVTEIVLNVKRLVIKADLGEEVKTLRVSRSTAGEVRAKDIEPETGIEIVNPDHLLCTLTANVNFRMELKVGMGRGYVTAEENRGVDPELGAIPVDSIYSPVLRVRYRPEDTRVGQLTNYDRLVLEIWTRGTTTPDDAIVEAAKILRKHLNPFVQYADPGSESISAMRRAIVGADGGGSELQELLARPISALELSARSGNCLDSARITTIGQLVQMAETDLLNLRSFGKTSLTEVKKRLAELGLTLGMKLGGAEPAPAAASAGSGFTEPIMSRLPTAHMPLRDMTMTEG
ncbi:MAG: DNA-directed RNA polymerase subunit alpha [Planctomycetota bacterium]|nr:MAG: DNA-directed RNA polymerase subunit alpha [Planctomycetota bacterium]